MNKTLLKYNESYYNDLINVNSDLSDYKKLAPNEIVEQIQIITLEIKFDVLQFKLEYRQGYNLLNLFYENLQPLLEIMNDTKTSLYCTNRELFKKWDNAYNDIKNIIQEVKLDIVDHYYINK